MAEHVIIVIYPQFVSAARRRHQMPAIPNIPIPSWICRNKAVFLDLAVDSLADDSRDTSQVYICWQIFWIQWPEVILLDLDTARPRADVNLATSRC
jgi:hypothetical protein